MADTSNIYGFLDSTVSRLRENYNSSGLRASGNWGRQLESNVEELETGIKMQILGEDYTRYITPPGRGSNRKKSPEEAKKLYPIVLRWMHQKGLGQNKTFAFRIALKWVYKGIPVPNKNNRGDLIDKVINEQWFRDGVQVAGGALLSEFNSDVIDRLKLK